MNTTATPTPRDPFYGIFGGVAAAIVLAGVMLSGTGAVDAPIAAAAPAAAATDTLLDATATPAGEAALADSLAV